jgi:hypothetical protein
VGEAPPAALSGQADVEVEVTAGEQLEQTIAAAERAEQCALADACRSGDLVH